MERAYREDELIDALVIDSEGYIYGNVGKINVDEETIILTVNESKPDVKTVVDFAVLEAEFLKNMKTPLVNRLQKLSPAEMLQNTIRKELQIKFEETLSEQHYIKYAEKMGAPLPYKKVSDVRKEPKGTVSLREIKTIRTSTIGTGKGSTVIKIVLLNEPREAAFRNIPLQKKVPYRETTAIKDKLILDSDGHALGYVDSLVLFHDKPGIRIYLTKMTGQVSLSWLNRYLEEIGRPDISESIRKHFGIERGSHIYQVRREELEDFIEKAGLALVLPEGVLYDQSIKEFLMDIPWDGIDKIGDVVLLKHTLPELKSKGYLR